LSLAWKVNFFARLLDGDHAYKLYRSLLRYTQDGKTNYAHGGGAYPNLFDAHPPFQIDGNFGGTAGLAEMLLQSQDQELYLLPALPKAWKNGYVKGLKARSNYTVGIVWKYNRIENASVKAFKTGICKIRTNHPVIIKNLNIHSEKNKQSYLIAFEAIANQTYELTGMN
jgi:alpha-L-fucosidase 2